MPQKWTKRGVIDHILVRYKNEQKLNCSFMQQECVPLFQAGCRIFGSWRKAIEASGLDYSKVKAKVQFNRKWTKEVVLETIKKMFNLNQPLHASYVQSNLRSLFGAGCRLFGGWRQAIEASGIIYSEVRARPPEKKWSKDLVVQEISKRNKKGLSISGTIVHSEDRNLYLAAMRYFGERGWEKARTLAGFEPTDPDPRIIWNEQSVTKEIARLHENGVDLSPIGLQGSKFSYIFSAGCRIFGTWSKAIRSANLDYSKIKKGRSPYWWTGNRVIMRIKQLKKQAIRLDSKAIQHSHGGLFHAALLHFGSWSEAVEEAGINYQEHCRVWSTKAYIRKMGQTEYKHKLERATSLSTKRKERKNK